jgi:ABC-2 type transport system ATP-binding protein
MYDIPNEIIKEKSIKLSKLFNIEDILNKNTENYSHGMKQKLIFCSAFLSNPDYIILDEPMV